MQLALVACFGGVNCLKTVQGARLGLPCSSLPRIAAQQGSILQDHAARAVRKSLVLCGLLRDREEPEEAARLEALFGLSDIAALCSCVADTVRGCMSMDKVDSLLARLRVFFCKTLYRASRLH